jgi:hypothetical protein
MHFLSAGLDRVGLIGSAMPPDCVLDDGPDGAVAGNTIEGEAQPVGDTVHHLRTHQRGTDARTTI